MPCYFEKVGLVPVGITVAFYLRTETGMVSHGHVECDTCHVKLKDRNSSSPCRRVTRKDSDARNATPVT